MSPTTGPHVANDSVLDVTAGARSAAAVIRHTPARGSLDAVDRADTRGECLNTRAGVEYWSLTRSQPGREGRPAWPARTAEKLRTVLWGWAGKPVDDAALEEVARVREALRGNLGEPLCGHLTGQRWTGCTPESLRCWIIR